MSGDGDRLGAVGGSEFREDADEIGFDAGVSEAEAGGDFLVGLAFCHQSDDFGLAFAE